MIRRYQPGDHPAIAEIFTRAIHEVACEVYTPAQCAAWSDKAPNLEHWRKRCERKRPYVYVRNGRVVGFLELDDDGHIDCMYVHPDAGRQGVASALIDVAIEKCIEAGLPRAFVEASLCARPVFEKKGFRVVKRQQVALGEERLINFQMELPVKADPG
ncbi:GNAT family N-acetyltransferase [Blastopirellula retiformator]|uniref:Putative N-acetyltransferase YafP n=1 Tax=Blastopirellula retiformator TaxID=2527970 RepID=A0A5C5V0R9_9BACT|nr:GNAT family N-acetyltransferase [Blastopirellula retiformator]TWT31510.1 putative N-acetyltransferase YafP [Blastopirellula retiformator]